MVPGEPVQPGRPEAWLAARPERLALRLRELGRAARLGPLVLLQHHDARAAGEASAPGSFDTLVLHLMEKESHDRPPDARTVAESLTRIEERQDTLARAGVTRTRKKGRKGSKGRQAEPFWRSLWFVGPAALASLACIGLFGWWVFLSPPGASSLLAQADRLDRDGGIERKVVPVGEAVLARIVIERDRVALEQLADPKDDVVDVALRAGVVFSASCGVPTTLTRPEKLTAMKTANIQMPAAACSSR